MSYQESLFVFYFFLFLISQSSVEKKSILGEGCRHKVKIHKGLTFRSLKWKTLCAVSREGRIISTCEACQCGSLKLFPPTVTQKEADAAEWTHKSTAIQISRDLTEPMKCVQEQCHWWKLYLRNKASDCPGYRLPVETHTPHFRMKEEWETVSGLGGGGANTV